MKVLIVEIDLAMAELIAFAFGREGFQTILVQDGVSALQTWSDEKPDLVILEIDLPRLDGFGVCHRIRKESHTPVIFLTSHAEEEYELRGLELGADSYMTKPFSPRQLVARARAILRRIYPAAGSKIIEKSRPLYTRRFDDFVEQVNPAILAPLEKRLLEYLSSNSGKILTYEAINHNVWGARVVEKDTLRHLIRRLRMKIEDDPANPRIVKTVPGLGYAFEEQPNAYQVARER